MRKTLRLTGIGESDPMDIPAEDFTDEIFNSFDPLIGQIADLNHSIDELAAQALRDKKHKESLCYTNLSEKCYKLTEQVEFLRKKISDILESQRPLTPRKPRGPHNSLHELELVLEKRNLLAFAKWDRSGRTIVLEDSTISDKEYSSFPHDRKILREQLKQSRHLVHDFSNHRWILKKDQEFTSPSAAADFVLGCSASGNIEWKDKNSGKQLGEVRKKTS